MSAELVCAATDPQWLERRREGITATDIVTIAGLVTWDSPWALYHRKLCLLPEVEETWRMRRGSWLEKALAVEWENQNYFADDGGLYRSAARPWQLATPDYLVRVQASAEHFATLECKSTQQRQGWGPDGSDIMPAAVRAQVLWQMDTLGVGTGHVAADVCGEFRSYTIRHSPRHDDLDTGLLLKCSVCAEIDMLRTLGLGFWQRLQDREPPDLDGLEVTTDALRYLHPAPADQVEIDKILMAHWDVETDAHRESQRRLDYTKNLVRAAMGDAHEATVGGRVVFRRTIGKRAGYTVPAGETDVLRRIGKDRDE